MEERKYSYQTGEIPTFSAVDYVVFALCLALSASIGLFFAIRDRMRKKENPTEFLLGGRSMSVVPVALSLAVTFLSALTLLGNPTEIYNFNTMFAYLGVAMLLAMTAAGFIFVPFFYRMGITNIFEYLELRFSAKVRICGSIVLLVQSLIYTGFILYVPSLALSSVTGLNLWGCVVTVGVVVTFYTTLGGMKAVVWTDALQCTFMLGGLLTIFIVGCQKVGGLKAAWDAADESGRIVFDNFSFDPTTRHSFWSIVVGGGVLWTSLYGVQQAQLQRCLSTSSVRKAQLAILINTPIIFAITVLSCLVGVVVYAFYKTCHPPFSGVIKRTDQVVPLFVMDILGDVKGVPGLFVSSIFSGSLSSLSSVLNALSMVVYQDFLSPMCFKNANDFTATLISKSIVVFFGLTAIAVAYLCSMMGDFLQATYSLYGAMNGPYFGLFVMGMFFPWANAWGALAGFVASSAVCIWLCLGAFITEVSTAVRSPLSRAGCIALNTTLNSLSETSTTSAPVSVAPKSYEGVEKFYTLAYLYYTTIGVLVMLVVGLVVSFATGHTRPKSLDPKLICPFFDVVFPFLPECILKPLRFGIDHKGKYEANDAKIQKEKEAEIQNGTEFAAYENNLSSHPYDKVDTGEISGVVNLAFKPTDETSRL